MRTFRLTSDGTRDGVQLIDVATGRSVLDDVQVIEVILDCRKEPTIRLTYLVKLEVDVMAKEVESILKKLP